MNCDRTGARGVEARGGGLEEVAEDGAVEAAGVVDRGDGDVQVENRDMDGKRHGGLFHDRGMKRLDWVEVEV